MRNYVMFIFGAVNYDQGGPTFTDYFVGRDVDQVIDNTNVIAAMRAGQGANVTFQGVIGKRYFLLDKDTVLTMAQTNPGYFWVAGTAIQQGTGLAIEGSPRTTGPWPSSDGLNASKTARKRYLA